MEHSNSRFLEGVELYTRVQSNSSLSGVSFDYSLLFREKVSKNLTLHATYIFKPSSKLSSNNTQTLFTVPGSGGYGGDNEERISETETIPRDIQKCCKLMTCLDILASDFT